MNRERHRESLDRSIAYYSWPSQCLFFFSVCSSRPNPAYRRFRIFRKPHFNSEDAQSFGVCACVHVYGWPDTTRLAPVMMIPTWTSGDHRDTNNFFLKVNFSERSSYVYSVRTEKRWYIPTTMVFRAILSRQTRQTKKTIRLTQPMQAKIMLSSTASKGGKEKKRLSTRKPLIDGPQAHY